MIWEPDWVIHRSQKEWSRIEKNGIFYFWNLPSGKEQKISKGQLLFSKKIGDSHTNVAMSKKKRQLVHVKRQIVDVWDYQSMATAIAIRNLYRVTSRKN